MMAAQDVLIAKLTALSVAMAEAACAIRLYAPDSLEMRRHARDLETAAGQTAQAIKGLQDE